LVVHLGVFELGCAFARLAQKACLKMGCKSPRRSAGVLSGFSLKKRNFGPTLQMHNQVQKHPNAQPSSKLKYQFHLRNFGADGVKLVKISSP
jgi:hypothetical protein